MVVEHSKNNNTIDNEVNKLFHKNNGKISSNDFVKLRQKYDDIDLVNKIQKAYLEKHKSIYKRAKKYAKYIREKYSDKQYPFHIILEKAKLIKSKYGLTEDEFVEFQRIYETELVGLKSSDVLVPDTNMMKVLGNVSTDIQGFSFKLNESDYKYLQEILKMYSTSRGLHAAVFAQSLEYTDCSVQSLSGEFRPELGNRSNQCVHPVIAALFLPKIDILDSHFLRSNLAAVVKARYNNEPMSRADFELFHALVEDPNDVVCDNRSSLLDLLNRVQIQQNLWDNVLNLRNGIYYGPTLTNFITSIDVCKLNKHDTPDLIYGKYDGTIIKRLLSAFSFRPTVISTNPVYNIVNVNPYQQNVTPVVNKVPMINLKIPSFNNDNEVIKLSDALEQQQFLIENGVMVPRHTSIIYSKGVLFFFVDRRSNMIKFNEDSLFSISKLPLSISGYERLNDREIEFDPVIKLRGDEYKLRSVVIAMVSNHTPEQNLIIGSSAMVVLNNTVYSRTNEHFMYDPMRAGVHLSNDNKEKREVISKLEHTLSYDNKPSFMSLGRKRGIIFMYELVSEGSNGTIFF
jgi:hypothetical protein